MPTTTRYFVQDVTCSHCVSAVITEVTALPGVTEVAIDLLSGDVSTVSVTSGRALAVSEVAKAISEAGYTLVDPADTRAEMLLA